LKDLATGESPYNWSQSHGPERSRPRLPFKGAYIYFNMLVLLFKGLLAGYILAVTLQADCSLLLRLPPNLFLCSLACRAW
jgi:hypothetical protein